MAPALSQFDLPDRTASFGNSVVQRSCRIDNASIMVTAFRASGELRAWYQIRLQAPNRPVEWLGPYESPGDESAGLDVGEKLARRWLNRSGPAQY